MYSKLICVVLLLSLYCWAANGQAAETCAEIGGYCQNHWDCCSGSCLSFSYKCVRTNRPAMFNPVNANPPQQTGADGTDLGNRFGISANCSRAGEYCQSQGDCCSQNCLSFSYKCIGDTISNSPQYPLFVQSGGQQVGTVDLDNRFSNGAPQLNPIFGGQQPAIVNSIDDLISSLNFNQIAAQPTITQTSVLQTQNRFGDDASQNNNKSCLQIGSRCENVPDCCSLNCVYNVCMTGYNQTNGAEHSNKPCLELGDKCFRHDECCSGKCHGFLHQCVT